ncbi:hypothetical protein LTR37_017470 [Vermiconidia calcicola]|uniref:Uncharacterized protein n=1 Tax=Vermiconidia calcicola TaxID=1690605 RepID=A0ACC3ML48_9PEZI|nr:hypothetical protein LTR37_017470 [Vermiconidia calcicola]
MRKRLLVGSLLGLFTQWSGNTLLSYYLGDILTMIGFTDSNFQAKINVGKTSWELVNATIIALIVTRFPRRPPQRELASGRLHLLEGRLGSCSSQRIASCRSGRPVLRLLLFTVLQHTVQRSDLQYVLPIRRPLQSSSADQSFPAFLVELFPYAVRSRGITVFQFFGRGASFFSTFVNPIGLDSVGWKYLIAYSCWLLFEVICIYFLWPETQGRTLEELTFLFEDKGLQERQSMATEKQLFGGDAASVGGRGNKDGTEERYEIAGSKL